MTGAVMTAIRITHHLHTLFMVYKKPALQPISVITPTIRNTNLLSYIPTSPMRLLMK